jgi:hypothetical protein
MLKNATILFFTNFLDSFHDSNVLKIILAYCDLNKTNCREPSFFRILTLPHSVIVINLSYGQHNVLGYYPEASHVTRGFRILNTA